MNRQIDDLIKLAHAHFVRIDQDGQLLVTQRSGLDKVIVDLNPAGFHRSKIKTRRKEEKAKAEAKEKLPLSEFAPTTGKNSNKFLKSTDRSRPVRTLQKFMA
jgi:hypothetical protein